MKAVPAEPPRTLTPARLRAVLTVAEEGSFSAAGRRLGISHSAVSQQIREMEAAHGIRLFDRIGDKRLAMLRNIRTFFHRADITDQEVRTLFGVIRALSGHRQHPDGRPKAE